MTDEMTSVAVWTSPAFHAEAADWVRDACLGAGIELTGEVEQPHARPWSSAIRFGSTAGPVWFKVNGVGTRHEPPLLETLARLVPDLVADVLGVDAARGWSLTLDAGPVMRSTAPPEHLWECWEALLQRYADAQIRLADRVTDLLATGTSEVSPVTLPGQAAELLKELSAVDPEVGGLTAQESEDISAGLPEYTAWCAELAASAIPLSLQHDDLHSGNVCWPGGAEDARVIDWGDASVGHPLGTMLCTLNSVAFHAGMDLADPAVLDDSRMVRVRDAYLEPFTAFARRHELVRYVELARRVGCVTRALSYRAALQGEPVATHADQDFPVRGWFLELLEV